MSAAAEVGCVPAVTRREAILAHLAGHPDLTAYELRRAIGAASHIGDLLRNMQAKAEVVARTERRPGQGRPVHVWRVAPSGAVPPPRTSEAAEIIARKRERDREATRARRARMRLAVPSPAAPLLTGAACVGEDPGLFFPGPGDAEAEAKAVAICGACPARAACYERAVQNREGWGIWGGVSFEARPLKAGA